MPNRALPEALEIAKLRRKSMAMKYPMQSEGAELESYLDALETERSVREITGWETGFTKLNRALDGLRSGLYLLIGPPACGKTSLARQLLDQVALHNRVAGVFFAFAESRKELRIRTLARLSGLENREIRRGSAYLLHWYGAPKAHYGDPAQWPPSWEKLKQLAQEAKGWLDLIYLVECDAPTTWMEIEKCVAEIRARANNDKTFVVIDDAQRLGASDQPLPERLPIVAEQLQRTALSLNIPLLALWPDLGEPGLAPPQAWAERVASPDVVLVLEKDLDRSQKISEPNRALTLHIVKNRGGEKGKLAFDFNPALSKFSEAG